MFPNKLNLMNKREQSRCNINIRLYATILLLLKYSIKKNNFLNSNYFEFVRLW